MIMTQLQGKVAAFVVFNKPGASASELHESDNWQHAIRIPGVLAMFDDRGTETQHFGGHVSGQTMLYSREGRLVFSGGITAGRGHQGNNIGAKAVIRIVRGDLGAPRKTPVFGCSLNNPSAQALIEEPSWKK
jgi:glyoxylase-like metal-dependent hydrolase (beta-lactamase superfamily II)